MPQQQRFVAGLLPDQGDRLDRGECPRTVVTLRLLPTLVGIEQDRAVGIGRTGLALASRHAPHGELDDRERVAAARLQHDGIEMKGQACRIGEPLQQGDIALFAFALASDEDAEALRALRAASCDRRPHPMRGTAP